MSESARSSGMMSDTEQRRAYREATEEVDPIAEVTRDLLEAYTFKTYTNTEEILVYDDGAFVPENGRIAQEVEARLGDLARNKIVTEVYGKIARSTMTDRTDFDARPEITTLRNKTVNLLTGEVMEHSPEHLNTVKIDIEYEPNITCPRIMQFLTEILPSEDDRNTIIDYFAYCLWRSYPIHKALMMVGSGRNGKSTLNRVLMALLGKQNVSTVSLHGLDNHRFMCARLDRKLANISPDLKARLLQETGNFKALTGNDALEVERKGREPYSMLSYAKIICATNRIPDTLDETDAYFDRWLIVNFPMQFRNENENKNLLAELTTPQELSGLFNMLMARIPEILKNGIRYSTKTIDENYQKYIASADPIRLFIEKALRQENGIDVPKSEVYETYKRFVSANRLVMESEETLGRTLKKHGFMDDRRREGQSFVRVWKNLKIVDFAAADGGQDTL